MSIVLITTTTERLSMLSYKCYALDILKSMCWYLPTYLPTYLPIYLYHHNKVCVHVRAFNADVISHRKHYICQGHLGTRVTA